MAGRLAFEKWGGTARRDKTLTVPCRCFEILAVKCGFDGQRSDEMTVARRRETATRTRF
jgi:hypothetical protein